MKKSSRLYASLKKGWSWSWLSAPKKSHAFGIKVVAFRRRSAG